MAQKMETEWNMKDGIMLQGKSEHLQSPKIQEEIFLLWTQLLSWSEKIINLFVQDNLLSSVGSVEHVLLLFFFLFICSIVVANIMYWHFQ